MQRERLKATAALTVGKKSVLFLYEHMGNVLVSSVLWATAVAVSIGLLFLLAPASRGGLGGKLVLVVIALAGVLLISAATATVQYTVNRMLEDDDPSMRDSLRAFRRLFWRAGSAGLVMAILMGILALDVWFFATVPKSIVVKAMGGLALWGLVFVAIVANYVLPLVVVQGASLAQAAKRASLMVLDNLGFSTVLGLLALLMLGISYPAWIVAVLCLGGVLAHLQVFATRELLDSYGELTTTSLRRPAKSKGK